MSSMLLQHKKSLIFVLLCVFGSIFMLSSTAPGGLKEAIKTFLFLASFFLIPSLIFRFVSKRVLRKMAVPQITHESVTTGESIEPSKKRKNIILLVMFLFIPASIMSIFFASGGLFFFFDAPTHGLIDESSRWVAILLVIISPVFLLVSFFKLKNGSSLKWGWFGVAPILCFYGMFYIVSFFI